MKNSPNRTANPPAPAAGRSSPVLWIILGVVALVVVGLLLPRGGRTTSESTPAASGDSASAEGASESAEAARDRARSRLSGTRGGGAQASPEQVVAGKVATFARDRRQRVEELAQRLQIEVSPEVHQLFDALESGNWGDIKGLYNTLASQRESGGATNHLSRLWPAIKDAYGVAEVAKVWPPQELLNYGQFILSSIRPGMIYIAGTDASRYIPTLMGETAGGERPVILSQNALADPGYLDYLGVLHGDRLHGLNREDTQRALTEFIKNHPAQPNQLQPTGSEPPGEGRGNAPQQTWIAGEAGLSGLNETLLQMLMEKNPGVSFALEQSVAMKGLYGDALPLGPILELKAGAAGGSGAPAQARAAESLNYWRQTAERLQADASLPPDSPTRYAYAQMANAQAGFFLERNLTAEAEQAYRVARDIAPASLDSAGQLSRFLISQGRQAEAMQVLDEFGRQNEEQRWSVEDLRKSLTAEPR